MYRQCQSKITRIGRFDHRLHGYSTYQNDPALLLGPRDIYDNAHAIDKVLTVPYDRIVQDISPSAVDSKDFSGISAEDLFIISKIIRRQAKLQDAAVQHARIQLARRLVRQSAQLGFVPAILFSSEEELRSPSTSPSRRHETVQALSALSKAGNGKATYLLANELYSLQKVEKALKAYKLAGKQGIPQAYTKLGRIHMMKGTTAQAAKEFASGAEAGEPNALFMMSTITADETKQIQYLRKAASAGSIEAAHNLGERYRRQGELDLAKEFLRLAAEKGFQPSQMNLAALLMSDGMYTQARRWFELAAKSGGELADDAQRSIQAIDGRVDAGGNSRCIVM